MPARILATMLRVAAFPFIAVGFAFIGLAKWISPAEPAPAPPLKPAYELHQSADELAVRAYLHHALHRYSPDEPPAQA